MIAMYVSICVHFNPYYVASCCPRQSLFGTMADLSTHRVFIPGEFVDQRHVDNLEDLPQWGNALQTGFISVDWMDKLEDEFVETFGGMRGSIFLMRIGPPRLVQGTVTPAAWLLYRMGVLYPSPFLQTTNGCSNQGHPGAEHALVPIG